MRMHVLELHLGRTAGLWCEETRSQEIKPRWDQFGPQTHSNRGGVSFGIVAFSGRGVQGIGIGVFVHTVWPLFSWIFSRWGHMTPGGRDQGRWRSRMDR
jgi:hypothetical protein